MEQTHTGPWKEGPDKIKMETYLPIYNLDQMCKTTNFNHSTMNPYSCP